MRDSMVDRRVLRAFYTQYVSVLLIVLVFGVAAFSASVGSTTVVSAVTPADFAQVPIARMDIANLFEMGEQGALQDSVELHAVAEILRNHDVRAVFRIGRSASLSDPASVAQEIQSRLDLLRQFFAHKGLPIDSIAVAVTDQQLQPARAAVLFEDVGRARDPQ